MNMFCKRWNQRLTEGSWTFQVHDYWTMPQDYSDMKKYCPDLYADLSTSSLIIFKGDLNYRKLVGDRDWITTTPFEESLRKFHPAPLCALRTLKADVVTGLKEGQADEVQHKDKNWMVNGNWAVISYCGTKHRWWLNKLVLYNATIKLKWNRLDVLLMLSVTAYFFHEWFALLDHLSLGFLTRSYTNQALQP